MRLQAYVVLEATRVQASSADVMLGRSGPLARQFVQAIAHPSRSSSAQETSDESQKGHGAIADRFISLCGIVVILASSCILMTKE